MLQAAARTVPPSPTATKWSSASSAQGGLDDCHLAFYKEGDLGDDGVWDNWRLEGPSFVWYFRGKPHVHVWVNVADDPTEAEFVSEFDHVRKRTRCAPTPPASWKLAPR